MSAVADVVVLGAGPAGTACACGLRRLGYSVVLIGESRNTAVEGISRRTHSLLGQAGLAAAMASVSEAGERSGVWADQETALSWEHVVERRAFDRALQVDAAAAGMRVQADWVSAVEPRGHHWRVSTRHGSIDCRFVIDARGRRSRRARVRGPSLCAVSQRFRTPGSTKVRTVIHPFSHGWGWLAEDGRGGGWLQVVEASRSPSAQGDLSQRISNAMAASEMLAARLQDAVSVGPPRAVAAVARLSVPAQAPGFLRVGDASVAMDPLSGHGLHEALRSAAVAIAASNTYLHGGEWAPIERFVNERASDVWSRATSTAAQFYRTQADCIPTSFWTHTAAAYESLAASAATRDVGAARIESRPVLNGSRIEMRRVVVTPERPRGVWQFDSLELSRLVDLLDAEPEADISRAAQWLSQAPAVVARATHWLASQGLTNARMQSEGRSASLDRGG